MNAGAQVPPSPVQSYFLGLGFGPLSRDAPKANVLGAEETLKLEAGKCHDQNCILARSFKLYVLERYEGTRPQISAIS